ncbi:MAG: ATP-binding protein [Chthoniobacterales bacterium]|nr:ATP-binding protein [Chthoniobacterales bacterium]
MIIRHHLLKELTARFTHFPVVALLGPRQVGKTTIAKAFGASWKKVPVTHFDLEDPDDLARLADPAFLLKSLKGLVVLDEIQQRPDLFPLLRVLADRKPLPARFLILGSAAPELLKNSSETLAGRVSFLELPVLSLTELSSSAEGKKKNWLTTRWVRGGFPRALLAKNSALSHEWRAAFIRTYLERDLPQLGITLSAVTLRRFWMMLAHYHGQTWNGNELARSLGVSDKTVSHYLDILEGTFMALRLLPWSTNLKKREVKAPKVYLTDSGILHSLLGVSDQEELLGHPKCGASWEGLMIQEIMQQWQLSPREIFFWKLHSGAELDLLVVKNGRRIGFEIKLTNAPSITPSMKSALEALQLHHLYVVCYGEGKTWPLAKKISAVPAKSLSMLKIN